MPEDSPSIYTIMAERVANAILGKINALIGSHNTNEQAHQDIREDIPSASSTTPSADTTAGGVGTGTTWARSDHTHPKSNIYAEASHTHPQYLTSHQNITGKEDKSNKVTSLSSSNTDTQYPSAKAVYDATFNLDILDCINENFTLLSLPQIIFTHDGNPFDGSTVHILEGYDKGAYVDWGDGTPIETYESTDTLKHSYSDSVREHIITIYGDILNLCNNSFENFIRMTSINIPSGVTSLGDYCFNGCTSLTSVVIPSSVTSLGDNCFQNCRVLTNVTIPSSVTILRNGCFRSCTNLVDYQLYWETPPVDWSSTRMPNNTDTYFTIPNGTTANYTAKGFPSDKLVERSE